MTGPIDHLQGTELVLVVEDEPFVRLSVTEVLRTFGYTVLEAATGEEAIIVCRQLTEPVDLIIADVVLPSMSGPRLVSELHACGADLKVLYMSGHGQERLLEENKFNEGAHFLQKPFSATALLAKVREVLDAS
jgi:CheY-like chemotaxis protein